MENINPKPAEHFLPILNALSEADLRQEIDAPQALRIASEQHRGKSIDIAYAPFDHINDNAEIVIVGITPGRQQMANALQECRRQLHSGATQEDALAAAKVYASFSGPMRTNLVAMLDDIGVARHLGVESTSELWGSAASKVHFTSALRYPVFVAGENYSGAPSMLRVPMLRQQLETWLADEMRRLPNALFVPLGPKVGEALTYLAPKAGVGEHRVLAGLPHPSGASAERIAYFLGRKSRETLSVKTNADKLDAARIALRAQMQKIGA